jgi:hypothetical protein
MKTSSLWTTLLTVFFQRREAFTQGAISQVTLKYPSLNWVICHSPYSFAFDGVEGQDWARAHHELDISFYREIGLVLQTHLRFFSFFFFILITF